MDDYANIMDSQGRCHTLTGDDMDDGEAKFIDPKNHDYGI